MKGTRAKDYSLCSVEVRGKEGERVSERERRASCSSHAKLTGLKLTGYNVREVL